MEDLKLLVQEISSTISYPLEKTTAELYKIPLG
jgi:hypothetical protein